MSTLLAPTPSRPSIVPASRAPAPGSPPGERPVVTWWGGPGRLHEIVRDHVEALGARLFTRAEQPPGTSSSAIVCPADQLRRRNRPVSPGTTLLVVTGDEPLTEETWTVCLEIGASAVLRLPARSEDLLDHLGALLRPPSRALVLGVHGGCGGAGASSTAARLAGAAQRRGRPTVLVDADPAGGGIDVLVEAPPVPGVVWDDLGPLDAGAGSSLLSGLPVIDGVHLLAAASAGLPDADRLHTTLSALARVDAVVVVDLGGPLVRSALPLLDRLLLVVPAQEHAVRAAQRRCTLWDDTEDRTALLVRRNGPLTPDDVAADLGLPLLGSFRDGAASLVPLLDVRRRGADRTCDQVLTELSEIP